MTELEVLYQVACDGGIRVNNFHISDTKKAACVHYEDYKSIVLDKLAIETQIEEKILLAEEIAHYETGGLYMIEATYNTPIARSNRRKYEARTKRRAAEKLCPLERIKDCFKQNIFDTFEIAEFLDLTPEFVSYAIDMYVARNELSLVFCEE